jgi:hypothetical protein
MMRPKFLLLGAVMLLALALIIFTGNLLADEYPPGDADGSGAVDIDDVVYLIDYIFTGGPMPVTEEAGDANCSGGAPAVDIDDVVYLIAYILSGGPAPCTYGDPSGSVVGHTGCKDFDVRLGPSSAPPDQDCMEWIYDGVSVLQITHANEGLNCCPVIVADIWVYVDTITIEEIDSLYLGGCYCLCLFDVEYEIVNLEPGEYRVKVIEPYVPGDQEPLEFTVDLRDAPVGSHCVYRDTYPWGYR